MLKLVYLTEEFYNDYSACEEIEKKVGRPYVRIHVVVGGVLWAIPFRSSIKHKNALWTDKDNRCGIDFSKAVAVADPERYISDATPRMRPNEYKVFKTFDEHRVVTQMQKYIKEYKQAKQHLDVVRNREFVKYSTLQYFEDYI